MYWIFCTLAPLLVHPFELLVIYRSSGAIQDYCPSAVHCHPSSGITACTPSRSHGVGDCFRRQRRVKQRPQRIVAREAKNSRIVTVASPFKRRSSCQTDLLFDQAQHLSTLNKKGKARCRSAPYRTDTGISQAASVVAWREP